MSGEAAAIQRSPGGPVSRRSILQGLTAWALSPDYDTGPFEQLGADFETSGDVVANRIGAATGRAFQLKAGVDFAEDWMQSRR